MLKRFLVIYHLIFCSENTCTLFNWKSKHFFFFSKSGLVYSRDGKGSKGFGTWRSFPSAGHGQRGYLGLSPPTRCLGCGPGLGLLMRRACLVESASLNLVSAGSWERGDNRLLWQNLPKCRNSISTNKFLQSINGNRYWGIFCGITPQNMGGSHSRLHTVLRTNKSKTKHTNKPKQSLWVSVTCMWTWKHNEALLRVYLQGKGTSTEHLS